MSARLLIVALDGADGRLLDRWSTDGTLPNLTDLRSRGAAKQLSAPDGITDDGLWASFEYAAELGEHGRYHWYQRIESGEMAMAYLGEAGKDAFWETLSRQGSRVAIFDIPKCGLPTPVNGIHLVDWLVHGRYFHEPKSTPEPLAAEVTERFGIAPPSQCGYEQQELTDAEVSEIESNLRTSVSQKKAAGLHYLSREKWDLFMIAFKESHCAGHSLWQSSDALGLDDNVQGDIRVAPSLKTIYTDLDAAVGELIDAAGPEASVIAFCTTEMEPNSTLSHLMPEIINRINKHLGESLFGREARRAWSRITKCQAQRPCELLPYNENCTALRINPTWKAMHHLTGNTGDKGLMLDEVESILTSLLDADTGQAVVAAIDRPSAEYAGKNRAQLPDLLVQYAVGTFPRAISSSKLGEIEADRPCIRPGNHAPGGLLIHSDLDASDVFGMQNIGHLASKVLHD